MKIFVTGGCGYVGSSLVPHLLAVGHEIVVVDTQWFGNLLPSHDRLVVIRGNYVDHLDKLTADFDCVIHLANIANDPSVDLAPNLSWEVNVLGAELLGRQAQKAGIGQLIYASSGSVYGVKEENRVTEDLDLVPISVYNKTKMVAERVLLGFQDYYSVHIVRPATVCGYSPRMRLDVSVNMFVMQAIKNGKITLFGGNQIRPNITMVDMVGVYDHFTRNPELPSGCYNAGFENLSLGTLCKYIQMKTGCEIVLTPSNDPRSYRQCSDKLLATGFKPSSCVDEVVDDLCSMFRRDEIEIDDSMFTVKWMKALELGGGYGAGD
jgi:nucleoside-diphosphate-sugar epimerase